MFLKKKKIKNAIFISQQPKKIPQTLISNKYLRELAKVKISLPLGTKKITNNIQPEKIRKGISTFQRQKGCCQKSYIIPVMYECL